MTELVAAMDASDILAVSHLSKTFLVPNSGRLGHHEFQAVSDVSFSLARGQSLGIVGESGSGKTTVARMIAGLEVPTSGTVTVAGQRTPSTAKPSARRARARVLQIVFQDPYTSLSPRQSIRASLDEVQRVHFKRTRSQITTRTDELLDAVGLSVHEAAVKPRSLSGGQRQRVAIARALAAEPELIILDEAVSALDVSVQAQILNLLVNLRTQFGLAYLLISHDLAVVNFLCEEVVVMQRGHVKESGSCASVLACPQDPYTAALVESVPQYVR